MGKKTGSVQLTLFVMPELRQRFKTACVGNGENMTTVLETLMDEYASKYEQSIKNK